MQIQYVAAAVGTHSIMSHWSKPARALFLQNTNTALTEKIAEDAAPGTVHAQDFAHITECFLWLLPCCDDATVLVDSYNGMHAAGLLWCKACYLEAFNTEEHRSV